MIIAANGGSDLIYSPGNDPKVVREVCAFLAQQEYVDGLFVNDLYRDVPGTLPFTKIGLQGSVDPTTLPVPAIIVNFKNVSLDSQDPLQKTRIEIADSVLQQGQGMHGSFSRADTWNFMAAIGPDFKSHYVDYKPVSNADVAITVASLIGLQLQPTSGLRGRVLGEALRQNRRVPLLGEVRRRALPTDHDKNGPVPFKIEGSSSPSFGRWTVLRYKDFEGETYYDKACFASAQPGTSGLDPCP